MRHGRNEPAAAVAAHAGAAGARVPGLPASLPIPAQLQALPEHCKPAPRAHAARAGSRGRAAAPGAGGSLRRQRQRGGGAAATASSAGRCPAAGRPARGCGGAVLRQSLGRVPGGQGWGAGGCRQRCMHSPAAAMQTGHMTLHLLAFTRAARHACMLIAGPACWARPAVLPYADCSVPRPAPAPLQCTRRAGTRAAPAAG